MKIYLVGIGMGSNGTITEKAKSIIEKADIVIGAKRMTNICVCKKIFNSYKPLEIKEYLSNNDYENVVVLLSGDVGFYSGAKKIIECFPKEDIELISGISSVAYFCSKLKMSWDDIKILSLHSNENNIIGYIKRYKKVFAILSNGNDINKICEKLRYYNMGEVIINIGQNLSYDDEKIITLKAEEINNFKFESLAVILVENYNTQDFRFKSISDFEFIRGDVPMTKKEIRTLSISELELDDNAIFYDIGAGTGSISVETALKIIDGKVYAIEQKEKAVNLIEQNKQKFGADNIEIIKGVAPKAFENLPIPTHAFIGGSSGKMRDIINDLFLLNKNIKVVLNVISLNTLSELMGIIKEKSLKYNISCINVANDKNIGNHVIMASQNPVYIIKIWR